METRFTPGPWAMGKFSWGGDFTRPGYEIYPEGECDEHRIAIVFDEAGKGELKSNSLLITAAPDGFDAAAAAYMAILQSPTNEWRVGQDGTLAMLRDYIAKATNHEPEDVQNFYESKAALAKARGETNE